MTNNQYAKAYKEVLEIIKYFPEEEYNKIPKEVIDFYKENMDKEYVFTIDPEKDLSLQNISKEANALIVTLFQDYFATEEQKITINSILELNEKKAEAEKSIKYNPDYLFTAYSSKDLDASDDKNISQGENVNNNTSIVEYKSNFFIKLKNYILKLLHLKS